MDRQRDAQYLTKMGQAAAEKKKRSPEIERETAERKKERETR